MPKNFPIQNKREYEETRKNRVCLFKLKNDKK